MRAFKLGLALGVGILLGLQIFTSAHTRPVHPMIHQSAPAFTHSGAEDWLNAAPINLDELKGSVVLIDFWTFACWNCYRSFPWLNALQKRYTGRRFEIIGVHTPEFEHERDREKIAQKIEEFGLDHPVMIDNDFSYWKAMANRYWPAFYLIDKRGVVRHVYAGETHEGDSQARKIGVAISRLLKEDVAAQ